ncbi:MAG TPA: DUF397 domain-containing protein [Actinophytocola sp.]|jgi:hypothetical protein|nr:DUF397 domain-containing protein [Actinophytocola sp.]
MNEQRSWRKSSASASADACVEVAGTLDAMRDSKDINGRVLAAPGLPHLVRHVKNGTLGRG